MNVRNWLRFLSAASLLHFSIEQALKLKHLAQNVGSLHSWPITKKHRLNSDSGWRLSIIVHYVTWLSITTVMRKLKLCRLEDDRLFTAPCSFDLAIAWPVDHARSSAGSFLILCWSCDNCGTMPWRYPWCNPSDWLVYVGFFLGHVLFTWVVGGTWGHHCLVQKMNRWNKMLTKWVPSVRGVPRPTTSIN